MPRAGETTDFGFDQVPLGEKQGRVDDVFRNVAHRYDLMNDLMSGGLHRAWKDALVTAVNPPKDARAFALLDLAGGTGDIAGRVAQAGGTGTRITVLDINHEMLEIGQSRAIEIGHDMTFIVGNAEALPLRDCSYDTVAIAFGIRNVPRIADALAEAYRVLRAGGRAAVSVLTAPDRSYNGRINVIVARHVPTLAQATARTFALGDAATVVRLFTEAGFRDAETSTEKHTFVLPSFDAYYGPFERGGGSTGQALASLPEPTRRAIREEMRRALGGDGGPVNIEVEIRIASGRK